MTRKHIADIQHLPCYRHIPTRLLYLHLCMICDSRTGIFMCSVRTLAASCQVTEREIRTAWHNLIDNRLIEQLPSQGRQTCGKVLTYNVAKKPAKQPENAPMYDIEYILNKKWLSDMEPIMLERFPMNKREAHQAATAFVIEMRSINKLWSNKDDCRQHFLRWIERRYLGIKTAKELMQKKAIFDHQQNKKQ